MHGGFMYYIHKDGRVFQYDGTNWKQKRDRIREEFEITHRAIKITENDIFGYK